MNYRIVMINYTVVVISSLGGCYFFDNFSAILLPASVDGVGCPAILLPASADGVGDCGGEGYACSTTGVIVVGDGGGEGYASTGLPSD